ncbi:MAG: hypothetical protein Alis3KO_41550 [Aliiglaciecola sp.]
MVDWERTLLIVTEHRHKGKAVAEQRTRTREYNAAGFTKLLKLVERWLALHRSAWEKEDAPVAAELWRLPREGRIVAMTVSTWFSALLTEHPTLSPPGTWRHHNLRAGGATACFSLNIPLERIAWWGGWSQKSQAIQKYIALEHRATPADFHLFGWLSQQPTLLQERFGNIFEPTPATPDDPQAGLDSPQSGEEELGI